jgi:serine/threonine-protein kinase
VSGGTLDYCSPEQAAGQPLDHRADLHGPGATYCELLTGRRPAPDMPVEDPRAIAPEVPASCSSVVLRATARAPADRYADAAEMLAALHHALARMNIAAA